LVIERVDDAALAPLPALFEPFDRIIFRHLGRCKAPDGTSHFAWSPRKQAGGHGNDPQIRSRRTANHSKRSALRSRQLERSGETSFEYERTVQPRPKLGRWTAELDELLAGNAAKSSREQLTLIRIFEELRGRTAANGTATARSPASSAGVGSR
jgi:hypothetical protein